MFPDFTYSVKGPPILVNYVKCVKSTTQRPKKDHRIGGFYCSIGDI